MRDCWPAFVFGVSITLGFNAVASVQTGATVKARLPSASRLIKPSDLRAQAEKLIADGMMPDLDTLLDAVGQIRKEYQPKILEARRQAKIHAVKESEL